MIDLVKKVLFYSLNKQSLLLTLQQLKVIFLLTPIDLDSKSAIELLSVQCVFPF